MVRVERNGGRGKEEEEKKRGGQRGKVETLDGGAKSIKKQERQAGKLHSLDDSSPWGFATFSRQPPIVNCGKKERDRDPAPQFATTSASCALRGSLTRMK